MNILRTGKLSDVKFKLIRRLSVPAQIRIFHTKSTQYPVETEAPSED